MRENNIILRILVINLNSYWFNIIESVLITHFNQSYYTWNALKFNLKKIRVKCEPLHVLKNDEIIDHKNRIIIMIYYH